LRDRHHDRLNKPSIWVSQPKLVDPINQLVNQGMGQVTTFRQTSTSQQQLCLKNVILFSHNRFNQPHGVIHQPCQQRQRFVPIIVPEILFNALDAFNPVVFNPVI
jgi:hypothetical protein